MMRRITIATLVALILLSALHAQDTDALMERGRALLDKGAYEEARSALLQGRRMATEAGDLDLADRFDFQIALAWQRQGTATPSSDPLRKRLLTEASEVYKRILVRRPEAGSAHNNLAQVYAELGYGERAAYHFEKAMETDDRRRAFYAQNYAEALAGKGDWERAEEVYRTVVYAKPLSSEAHEILMKRYHAEPDRLVGYLWGLVDHGQVVRAQDAALDALERGGLSSKLKDELMAVIAISLSEQYLDLGKFAGSETAKRFARLKEDEDVGAGVRELLALMKGETWNPAAYSWWAGRGQSGHDPTRGRWPLDAFRSLSRAVAQAYRRTGNVEAAEKCYKMTARLLDRDPDPKAYEGLAELLVTTGRKDELEAMIRQDEVEMFSRKGEAYRNSQQEKILDFHRTLGKIYGYLGEWGDSDTANSAIFQLEHARTVAGRIEERAPGAEDEAPLFDADMAQLLAKGYEAEGRTEEAAEVRVATAERYEQTGRLTLARHALEGVTTESVPSAYTERYKVLIDNMKKVDKDDETAAPPSPPNTLRVD